jgi:acetoacetyl-CoA synthetase
MNKRLWTPTLKQISNSNLYEFITFLAKDGHQIEDYQDLYEFSIRLPQLFWKYLWDFGSFIQHQNHSSVLSNGESMLEAQWFSGAKFNFAQNLLKYRDDRPAVTAYNERGKQQVLTYAQLYQKVLWLSTWLKKKGVQPGDRVAAFMPNVTETIITMLAAVSLGAVWSSCSPNLCLRGALDYFGQIKPKIVITTDGYFYNGKTLNCLENLRTILKNINGIKQVIVVQYADKKLSEQQAQQAAYQQLTCNSKHYNVHIWNTVLTEGENLLAINQPLDFSQHACEIEFATLPFSHPLYIFYNSDSTSNTRCIVHSAGGTLIQHYKELVLHTDVKSEDSVFCYTSCNSMMWNWMTSTLMTGASLVIFDGSPLYPNTNTLWNMIEQQQVSIFCTNEKYLSALEEIDYHPNRHHDLNNIRMILSTSSPLSDTAYAFAYNSIKEDMCLSIMFGGGDIISYFILGNPTLPVYQGEIQCLGLGIAINVYDDNGDPLEHHQQGELVCEKPFPALPIGFYNDKNNEQYISGYFEKFPNIFSQGDIVEKKIRSFNNKSYTSLIIHKRSSQQ